MGNSKRRGLTLFSFIIKDDNWLVVSTPPKNISQLGLLFPIYGKTNVPNHQPDIRYGITPTTFLAVDTMEIYGIPRLSCGKKAATFICNGSFIDVHQEMSEYIHPITKS